MFSELDYLQLVSAAVEESEYSGQTLSWNTAKKRVLAYTERYSEVYEEVYAKELMHHLSEDTEEEEARELAHDHTSNVSRCEALETVEDF